MKKGVNEVGKIFSTGRYELFSYYPFNRDTDHAGAIAKSMDEEDFSRDVPILVEETKTGYKVIDGQNRLKAWEQRGSPVYFIVTAYNNAEKEMARINSNQKNWTITDFMKHFIYFGREEYVKLNKALAGTMIPLTDAIYTLWTAGTSSTFKRGEFVFTEKLASNIELVDGMLKIIQEYSPYDDVVTSKLVRGCYNASTKQGFKFNKFRDAFQNHGMLFVLRSSETDNSQEIWRLMNM